MRWSRSIMSKSPHKPEGRIAGSGISGEPGPATSAGTKVQFYHLTATPLERALPKLLEKALAGGFRVLLVAESEERIEQLNQLLWTYDPGSFLAHGSRKDGHAEEQPILL